MQPVFHPIEVLLGSLGTKGLDYFISKFVFISVFFFSIEATGNIEARLMK